MDWNQLLLPLLFVVFLVLLFPSERRRYRERRGDLLRSQAEKLRLRVTMIYLGEHRERRVAPRDFPALDQVFYDDAAAALERAGYLRLGDVVDETMAEVTPEYRSFHRVLVSADRRVVACLTHLRLTGWRRLMAPLTGAARDLRVVEFRSELEDARFVMTANAPDHAGIPFPPSWPIHHEAPDTDVTALQASHREHLRRVGGVVVPLPGNDPEASELDAAGRRFWSGMAAFFEGRRGLTREEWEGMIGTRSRLSRELVDEIAREPEPVS